MKKFCLTVFAMTSVAVFGLYLLPPTSAAASEKASASASSSVEEEEEEEAADCYKLLSRPGCVDFAYNCNCSITTTSGVVANDNPGEADNTATPQVNATPIPRFVQQSIGF